MLKAGSDSTKLSSAQFRQIGSGANYLSWAQDAKSWTKIPEIATESICPQCHFVGPDLCTEEHILLKKPLALGLVSLARDHKKLDFEAN